MQYVLIYAEHTESIWEKIPGVLGGSIASEEISNEMRLGEALGPERSRETPSGW